MCNKLTPGQNNRIEEWFNSFAQKGQFPTMEAVKQKMVDELALERQQVIEGVIQIATLAFSKNHPNYKEFIRALALSQKEGKYERSTN